MEDIGKLNAIASRIINYGVDNVDLSMLNPEKKSSLLTDIAILLFKKGRIEEAVKTLVVSENKIILKKWFDDFVEERKSKYAALCAVALKDNINIEKWAVICLEDGNYETALLAFNALGKKDMVDFIKANF